MTDLLIVDGYNILHALDRYRRYLATDRQAAVDKLVADMMNLTGTAAVDIVVVFDGQGAGGVVEEGRLKVVYTGEGRSADAAIERLAFESSADAAIAVCTGDYAQQKVIGRKGVKRMAPRELEDLMTVSLEEADQARRPGARARLEGRLPEAVRRRLEEMRRS